MPSKQQTLLAEVLGLTAVLLLVGGVLTSPLTNEDDLAGRLLPAYQRGTIPWRTFTAEELKRGVSVPSHVNILFHVPEDGKRISRKTLFGHSGERVRYWGYCFPANEQAAIALKRAFPGRIFLSESERAAREMRTRDLLRKNIRSVTDLTEERLNLTQQVRGKIRHEQEVFEPGSTCYLMTQDIVPLAMDDDEDGVNNTVERQYGANIFIADTDGDGVPDGHEIFRLETNPILRDTDGDGLIDGVEDGNQNGRIDQGESNPSEWDSDHDHLCDGLCRVNKGQELRGEDKNLDGVLDETETSPTLPDTDGDGVTDEQEYFNCKLAGGADC